MSMFAQEEKIYDINTLIIHAAESEISSIKNVTSGIIKIINDPNSNARDLKHIIEIDPPLTAKVLRVANSAYYYSKKRISEIDEAVIWIGFDKLKEIALSQKVCEIFNDKEDSEDYSRVMLWKHSVAVGMLGKMICRMEFGESGDNMYAAGLLHDIGIIVEDQFMLKPLLSIFEKSDKENLKFYDAEKEILGYDHQQIGKMLTEQWNFPAELSLSIGFHHCRDFDIIPREVFRNALILMLANHLCLKAGITYRKNQIYSDPILYKNCIRALEVKPLALELIVNKMIDEIQKMELQGLF